MHTDPKWQQSGADSPSEYEQWTWCDCGITCFKMVLAANNKQASFLPLVKLAKEATLYGAFKVSDVSISHLHYAEFCTYVREKHGLQARSISTLSVCALKEQVVKGNFVIASVHPSIRHTNSIPPKRGGHLVLIVGYDEKVSIFIIPLATTLTHLKKGLLFLIKISRGSLRIEVLLSSAAN